MSDPPDRDPGRKPRFVVPPGSHGGTVLGLFILAAGVTMLVLTGRLLSVSAGLPVGRDNPGLAVLLVAATLVAIGVGILSWGLAPRLRKLRRRARPTWGSAVPGTEHPWDLRGAKYTRWGRGIGGTLATLAASGVLFVLGWFVLALPDPGERWVFAGLSLVFGAGVLALATRGLRLVGDGLKWGTSRLLFQRFPFVLGGTVEVRLPDTDALLGFTCLKASLRCVREEVTASGLQRDVSVAVLREQSRTFGPNDVPIGKGDAAGVFELIRRVDEETFLDLSFPLPDEDLGTVLGDAFARYWELEISADTPGLPFGATFLLPIYSPVPERPAGPRAGPAS